MYRSCVPLLIIRTDSPALIEVNGQMLGESGNGRYVALPVSETGDYFVAVSPLIPLCYGVTRKLSFLEGQLGKNTPEDVSLYAWPGGVYECRIKTAAYPSTPKRRFPRSLDSIHYQGYAATLYVEELLRLSFERGGSLLYSYCLGEGESGELERYKEYLAVKIFREGGMRLLLLDQNLEFILDLEAEKILLEEDIACIDALSTLRGHERRIRYTRQRDGFSPQRPETGFFTHPPREGSGPRFWAAAFFEALREGLDEEARSYLSEDLKANSELSAIRDFLGSYQGVEAPVSDESGRIMGLISPCGERLYRARLYELSFVGEKIDNIAEL